MPKLLISDTGKVKVSATGNQLADKNCCCTPVCPPVSTVFDVVAASKNKCGHYEFSGYESSPPKVYLTDTYRITGDGEISGCGDGFSETTHWDYSFDETYGFDCEFFYHNCSGSSETHSSGGTSAPYDCVATVVSCDSESGEFNLSGTFDSDCSVALCQTYDSLPDEITATTFKRTSVGTGGGGDLCECEITETNYQTLSDEYTDEMVIDNARSDLPAYDGDFDDAVVGGAFMQWVLGYQLTIQRFRYKHTFPKRSDYPGWSGYLKIYWNERQFASDHNTIIADIEKTWTLDPDDLDYDPETTESPVYEVIEPTITQEEGYSNILIVNKRYSTSKSYVPIMDPRYCQQGLALCDCNPETDDFHCCEGTWPDCCDPDQEPLGCDWINCSRAFREPPP